ncbi:MAG: phosphate ABC transporter permease PstA [Pseudomonadota bacterium]
MDLLQGTIGFKRRFKNRLFSVSCVIAAAIALLFFLLILFFLIKNGMTHLNLTLFTQDTPAPQQAGGLRNAIIGSIMVSGLGIIIAAPLGILIATFLANFSGKGRLAKTVRFVNDVLLSTPSIVIGLFAYSLCVRPFGHFSAFAGAVALAMIALPMITRSSEDVLYLVPSMLEESAVAMGIARWRITFKIVYRVVSSGLITGSLLAFARISGETAPLLFTALNNNFTTLSFLKPVATLPVVIYQFALSPYKDWQNIAWAGALLITVAILLLNLFARFLARK